SYALTDASKFGQIHPYPLSSGYQVGHVITDETLDAAAAAQLREQAIEVIQIAAG
ncbi:DeoR family transcriptional regulator, partial [Pantoea agglomerans]|nr:DeoR family transcriptional regulator [Pantoea agglomerans]